MTRQRTEAVSETLQSSRRRQQTLTMYSNTQTRAACAHARLSTGTDRDADGNDVSFASSTPMAWLARAGGNDLVDFAKTRPTKIAFWYEIGARGRRASRSLRRVRSGTATGTLMHLTGCGSERDRVLQASLKQLQVMNIIGQDVLFAVVREDDTIFRPAVGANDGLFAETSRARFVCQNPLGRAPPFGRATPGEQVIPSSVSQPIVRDECLSYRRMRSWSSTVMANWRADTQRLAPWRTS